MASWHDTPPSRRPGDIFGQAGWERAPMPPPAAQYRPARRWSLAGVLAFLFLVGFLLTVAVLLVAAERVG